MPIQELFTPPTPVAPATVPPVGHLRASTEISSSADGLDDLLVPSADNWVMISCLLVRSPRLRLLMFLQLCPELPQSTGASASEPTGSSSTHIVQKRGAASVKPPAKGGARAGSVWIEQIIRMI